MEWFLIRKFKRMGSRTWGNKRKDEGGGGAFSRGCRKSPGMLGDGSTKPAKLGQTRQGPLESWRDGRTVK